MIVPVVEGEDLTDPRWVNERIAEEIAAQAAMNKIRDLLDPLGTNPERYRGRLSRQERRRRPHDHGDAL
ncbi:MAG TPA: hypothetical protein VJK08_02040 [Patescibacteria group bacterium]|nr:hypothetical protein [Patescibacteria group bacterium]